METKNFQGPGFTMQIPTTWFITSSPQIQAMFVAPPVGEIRANLMITMRPLDENVALKDVMKTSLATQEKEYPEFKLIEEKEYKLKSASGSMRAYKWFSPEHNTHLLQKQFFFLNNRMLTTVTTTRTDSEEKVAKELDHLLDRIVKTLNFA